MHRSKYLDHVLRLVPGQRVVHLVEQLMERSLGVWLLNVPVHYLGSMILFK